MSSLRIQNIGIKAFKAFPELSVPLNGGNLLIYGKNGAGKSSIYWALYTFLQSAQKQTDDVAKYFDPDGNENLVNNQPTTAPKEAAITVTFQNENGDLDSTYTISKELHETKGISEILYGDLASDFITYRILFSFYHHRNSQKINLWQVFEDEMLPFCQANSVPDIYQLWVDLKAADPFAEAKAASESGMAARRTYNKFDGRVDRFNTGFIEVLARITKEAQAFYEEHFAEASEAEKDKKIMLGIGLSVPAKYDRRAHKLIPPKVSFEVKDGPNPLHKPHSYLNEAKLTQLALSVRFGATLARFQESPIKLLVLDDLLISLDMSNRMKVVKIILGKDFAGYQKVILTHDIGFFQEIMRKIGTELPNWQCFKFAGDQTNGRRLEIAKNELDQAKDYLANDQLSECGNKLRQHVEGTLTTFLEQARKGKALDQLVERKSFASLHHKLNEASSVLELGSYKKFASLLQASFTLEQLQNIVSPDEIDPNKIVASTKKEKEAIIGKLYAARPNLHQCILEVLSDASRKRLTAQNLLDEVKNIKDRILNPASHAGEAPLYTQEAKEAIKVIQALDSALTAALKTLPHETQPEAAK